LKQPPAYLVAILRAKKMYFLPTHIREASGKEGYFVTESLEEGVMSDLN
jgi:hypothetical protein